MGALRSTAKWMLVGLAVAVCALVVYAPKLRLGGGTVVVYGRTVQANSADVSEHLAQITQLKADNERLQEALKRALAASAAQPAAQQVQQPCPQCPQCPQGTAGSSPNPLAQLDGSSTVPVDLVGFLGVPGFFSGVSYDPYVCFPSLRTAFKDKGGDVQAAIDRAKKDLAAELAKIKGTTPDKINIHEQYHLMNLPNNKVKYPRELSQAVKVMGADPDFPKWREAISLILGRYLTDAVGNLFVTCEGVPNPADVNKLGSYCKDSTAEAAIKRLGFFNLPFESINNIMEFALGQGTCTTHVRNFRSSYADWIIKDRMTPEWKTFDVETPEQDHVMLLFDMLYEKLHVFTRQYWMGVITMQNPFDMYSIQDIIFSTQPDLLIETGTANGGSALLWSSVMELCGLEDSKIITVDLQSPVWEKGTHWGGKAREDPTQNKMWKKRVTFMKGDTVDAGIVAKIKAAAQGKKVLVTLDSGHHREHVFKELEAYCPLVSVGSYCIVEDTKMSRWHSTGPLEAVKDFLKTHPEFQVDRSRELLYTHHVMGYLKRIK